MATLHIISCAYSQSELAEGLRYCAKEDTIMFIQDGCYNLSGAFPREDLKVYALTEDMNARNIDAGQVQTLDYEQFVALSLSTNNSISW